MKVKELLSKKRNFVNTYVRHVKVTNEQIYQVLLLFRPDEVFIKVSNINKNSKLFDYLSKNKIAYVNLAMRNSDVYDVTVIMAKVNERFLELLEKIMENDLDYVVISPKSDSYLLDSYLYDNICFDSSYAVENEKQNYQLYFDFEKSMVFTRYRKDMYDCEKIKKDLESVIGNENK